MTFGVRAATPDDVPWLAQVERSAAETFLDLPDLAWIVTDGVTDDATHHRLIAAGAEWVADDEVGEPVGFLAGERIGPDLHIWELAVAAAYQRHGLGRRLIDAAEAQARAEGLTGITLTTFRTVPWNGPFYARLGFAILEETALPDHLADALSRERARRLPDRVAMRKAL
jgi:ribosomal protein S18 acetylase RimI-like enzyme